MTAEEFNFKYKTYLEKGHYGLDLHDQPIIDYLDKEFEELIKLPNFSYSQIKQKFNTFRFYCVGVPTHKITEIEDKLYEIDNIPTGYRAGEIVFEKPFIDLGKVKEERIIVYNAIKCLMCGAVLESTNRHDYNTCSCDNKTMVDGGLSYVRYGGIDMTKVKLITHYFDEPHELIRNFAFRSGYGKDGLGEYTITRIANMSDDYLKQAIKYLKGRGVTNKNWSLKILKNEKKYRKDNKITIGENL